MSDLTTERAVDAIARTTDGWVAMLQAAPPDAGDQTVAPLTWTVRDVALHVLSGLRSYRARLLGGEASWKSFATGAEDNDRLIAGTPEHELGDIAAALPIAAKDFANACVDAGDTIVSWHEDVPVPAPAFAGMGASELLLHGRDVARALRESWRIERGDAAMATAAALDVAQYFVDDEVAKGFTATYDLHLRGGSHYTLRFDNGALTTAAEPAANADCRINTDPLAFLLVAYKRTGLAQPVLTFKMLAAGRKPWLAFKLPKTLRSP